MDRAKRPVCQCQWESTEISSGIVHCNSTDIITTDFRQRPLGLFADVKSRRMSINSIISPSGPSEAIGVAWDMVKGCQQRATYMHAHAHLRPIRGVFALSYR